MPARFLRTSLLALTFASLPGCGPAPAVPEARVTAPASLSVRVGLAASRLLAFTPTQPWAAGDVDHVVLAILKGGTSVATATVSDVLGGRALTFTGLDAGATYVIRARAYRAAAESAATLISVDADSSTSVTLPATGDAALAGVVVQLADRPSPIVVTFAGSGAGASTDGEGTAAGIKQPFGLARGAGGVLYVAEYGGKIRKITPEGVVSTLAGTGIGGAEDETGTAASFDGPAGLAVDGDGTCFVAELGGRRIRKVTAAGVVTILAGAPADVHGSVGGDFDGPTDVALDGSGNLYVADMMASQIKKVTSAGVVSLLAGSAYGFADGPGASAEFKAPRGVAAAADGTGLRRRLGWPPHPEDHA